MNPVGGSYVDRLDSPSCLFKGLVVEGAVVLQLVTAMGLSVDSWRTCLKNKALLWNGLRGVAWARWRGLSFFSRKDSARCISQEKGAQSVSNEQTMNGMV